MKLFDVRAHPKLTPNLPQTYPIWQVKLFDVRAYDKGPFQVCNHHFVIYVTTLCNHHL